MYYHTSVDPKQTHQLLQSLSQNLKVEQLEDYPKLLQEPLFALHPLYPKHIGLLWEIAEEVQYAALPTRTARRIELLLRLLTTDIGFLTAIDAADTHLARIQQLREHYKEHAAHLSYQLTALREHLLQVVHTSGACI